MTSKRPRGSDRSAQPLPGSSKNVLVVEDDAQSAEVIAVALQDAGFGVGRAASREEALALLDCYIYDYLLLDYYMPGMNAGKFVDIVRSKRPRSRIVLMTAGNQIDRYAAELGIPDTLPKPFDPVSVAQRLTEFAEAS